MIKEAKGQRSVDMLELVAKSLLFRPTYSILSAADEADTASQQQQQQDADDRDEQRKRAAQATATTLSSMHKLVTPLLSRLQRLTEKHSLEVITPRRGDRSHRR
jgi:hypothetical protein